MNEGLQHFFVKCVVITMTDEVFQRKTRFHYNC